ncbi:MAG: hypothetical protein KBC35_03845 [Candidatus Pacebacteria bacterium]|nr:hypothetical protein [Candidatus Paceibacterota bacterium]
MNDTTQQQKKDSILKSLAILGFIGTIVLIAWLSIQLISVLPSAFSSLASLAESVYKERDAVLQTEDTKTLTIVSNTTLVNTEEPVTITWNEATVPGNFTFSYKCAEGVAFDLQEASGVRSITCDTAYDIGTVTELTFKVTSEKSRYADVWYTVSFLGTNDTTARASDTAQLTVINSSLSNNLATDIKEEESVTPKPAEPESNNTTPPTPVAPEIESNQETATTPQTPITKEEYTYVTPVSNPNGNVDLATRYLGLGKIVNNRFVTSTVRQSEAGAIQFEVKNHGTKTSGTWSYTVTLPGGGSYTGEKQAALKPNERAVITIGFPAATVDSHTFMVTVDEANDKVSLNDTFKQKVTFVKR